MSRALNPAEREAERVLSVAREEFGALGEPWDNYAMDVELIGSLLFGLGVQRVPNLQVGERAYAGFLDAEDRLIAVEESHHEHRQRFSIAHEIGHFVLHYLPRTAAGGLFVCSTADMEIESIPSDSASSSRHLHWQQESEANLFAGALLLPEPPLRAMHRVTGGRVTQLARHFNVSPQAMSIRLDRLGLRCR